MSFVVYFLVTLIAAGSVLFGLDWLQAPLSPMPASKYELRAAAPRPAPAVAKVEPKNQPRIEPKTEPKPEPKPAAAPAPAVVATAPPLPADPPVPPVVADQQPASIVMPEPEAGGATPAAAPKCNIEVCAASYRSFTAADCTYQPNDGPRRLCTKGPPPAAATTMAPTVSTEARAQACNIPACAASYPRSFSAADCTFQPSEGPRRLCTK